MKKEKKKQSIKLSECKISQIFPHCVCVCLRWFARLTQLHGGAARRAHRVLTRAQAVLQLRGGRLRRGGGASRVDQRGGGSWRGGSRGARRGRLRQLPPPTADGAGQAGAPGGDRTERSPADREEEGGGSV